MFKKLLRTIHYLIYRECRHEGPVVAEGSVCPEAKQNHPPEVIGGWWLIRTCKYCGGYFAGPRDLVASNIILVKGDSNVQS